MVQLENKKFKLDLSISELKDLGFKYDNACDTYTYRFTVYRYNKNPLIFCKIGIDEETNRVWYNVYNADGSLYCPFYNREYGVNGLLSGIEKNILIKLKELGAEIVR